MRENFLKLLFHVEDLFDWESKKFFAKSRRMIKETEEFQFYQDCEKQKRDFEKELTDYLKQRLL